MWTMWQHEDTLKQMGFICINVKKGFVTVAFVERKDTIINYHLQLHLGKGIIDCG